MSGFLTRRRTWRSFAAIPCGLALGWWVAGFAAVGAGGQVHPRHEAQPGQSAAPQGGAGAGSDELGDDRVGDEQPAVREAEVGGGALEHADRH